MMVLANYLHALTAVFFLFAFVSLDALADSPHETREYLVTVAACVCGIACCVVLGAWT